ncbi:MAG: hypothetical protein JWQ03_1601, partial [Variovorax sp.]|nr:hypothetical protein [Variovorax sp.]
LFHSGAKPAPASDPPALTPLENTK